MDNNGWITDRLPTAEDADTEGYVWVWNQYNGSMSEHYKDVHTETPWAPKCPPPPYVKPRWKPKKGEEFWYIIGLGVGVFHWQNDNTDNELHGIGNCFQTKEEAEETFEKITQLLKEHHDGK